MAVRQALAEVAGVDVSYDERLAEVRGDASMVAADLIRAVVDAGFEASLIAD